MMEYYNGEIVRLPGDNENVQHIMFTDKKEAGKFFYDVYKNSRDF